MLVKQPLQTNLILGPNQEKKEGGRGGLPGLRKVVSISPGWEAAIVDSDPLLLPGEQRAHCKCKAPAGGRKN